MTRLPEHDLPGVVIYRRRSIGAHPPDDSNRKLVEALLPNGREPSDFWLLFRPILSELDEYAWLLDSSDAFNWLWEDAPFAHRLDNLLDAARHSDGDFFSGRPGLMTELAPYVRDDWNSLYGFARPPADVSRIIALWNKDRLERELLQQVDVLFENWDGAFWGFYTPHGALLDKVARAVRADERFRLEEQSLRQTHQKCNEGSLCGAALSFLKRLLTGRKSG